MSRPNPILALWNTWSRRPFGDRVFAWMIGRMIPYTGTVRPRVIELRPGYAKTTMADRRRVRNHLDSIHAVALVNLGEFTSGIAMVCGLPRSARSIVTGLEIEYVKKARGPLTATCSCTPPDGTEDTEVDVTADIVNAAGDRVATFTARWKVGPKP